MIRKATAVITVFGSSGYLCFKRVSFECLGCFQQHVSTQMACGLKGGKVCFIHSISDAHAIGDLSKGHVHCHLLAIFGITVAEL